MLVRRMGRLLVSLFLLAALGAATAVRAEEGAPPVQPAAVQDYREAQYVYIVLGQPTDDYGIRLVEDQPDGLTQPVQSGGRRSVANAVGPDRYFYFDVADSYIRGGFNQVIMTITYDDIGLTPFDLEYDAYDVINPANKADGWVKKRVTVASRTNSGSIKTARLVLDDARFDGNQPGGADFRLVSTDDLLVRNVSVMRSFAPTSLPVRVVVDGKEVAFDVPPFIHPETGRTLVPMRRLFNALGVADGNIVWDEPTRTVTAKKGETTIILRIDSDQAVVGSRTVKLDQPATIQENRTVIPVRFVSENLGLKVSWDSLTHLITISSQQTP